MAVWITLAVLAVLLLLALGVCHLIGKKFLRNLTRKNPGEAFTADFDISFYQKSPLRKLAQDGMDYMETLPCEDVYITSQDGLKLHATLFPAGEKPKAFVLGIHGFQSHARNEFGPHIAYYRSLGFSMLLPDDRAHGYSEGQYITMGVKDRRDCVEWAKYLVKRFGPDTRILLHGVSMGGAAVLSASGESDLPSQVIGVVSDCGFTCVEEAFAFQVQNLYHVPSVVPVLVTRWYAKHRAGFDFDEARPIDQVKKARVPILFAQGAEDCIVPAWMAQKLYDACTAPKKLLLVPGASHAESVAIDPAGYHKAIEELFGLHPTDKT